MKTECPFCEGNGCCYCEYTGKVLVGDGCLFQTIEAAKNHNPEESGFDYEVRTNRRNIVTGKIKQP